MKNKNDNIKNNEIKPIEQVIKKVIKMIQQERQQTTIMKNIEREIALNMNMIDSVYELILLANDFKKHEIGRALNIKQLITCLNFSIIDSASQTTVSNEVKY